MEHLADTKAHQRREDGHFSKWQQPLDITGEIN